MTWRDINDPRDPWAWRNVYTGEARTDYAELWIVIPLTVILILLALLALIPLYIHKYCRAACPCQVSERSVCRFPIVWKKLPTCKDGRFSIGFL